MNKLPPGDRFFDVNDLWYFANRPVVRFLVPKPITPNQITVLSLIVGLGAAASFLLPGSTGLVWGAVLLYGKIFLDNVDGNLARVRGEVSRIGRFLDSLTDFFVTALVYLALSFHLVRETGDAFFWTLGMLALFSALLQCSYFVFYLVSYTTAVGSYEKNRLNESVSEDDLKAQEAGALDKFGLTLQQAHVILYGWQDRLIETLDRASRKAAGIQGEKKERQWVADKRFLTWISPLCLCTNNMLLVVVSLLGQVGPGLWLVAVGGNVYLILLQIWKVLTFRLRLG